MKTIKTLTLLFSLALLLASCQDVIEIDLNSIDPIIVIDGAVTSNDTIKIKISKSGDYFDPGIYPAVSNAKVTITDNLGNTSSLTETDSGLYVTNLPVSEGTEYTLKVVSENQEYSATVSMPDEVMIDSLSYEPTPKFMEFSGGYLVSAYAHDPAGVKNYYRMNAYSLLDSTNTKKYLKVVDDAFVDGNVITFQWDVEQFMALDKVVFELQCIDKASFDYYTSLAALFEGGMIGSSNPSNPETNLSNGALGHFGAYTISRDTIMIEPQ